MQVDFRRSLIAVAALVASVGGLAAEEFRIEEVPSVTAVAPARLKPRTIVFSDHLDD